MPQCPLPYRRLSRNPGARFVLWGDAMDNKELSAKQKPRSYVSQCYTNPRSLQGWGIFGQHLGMYHRTGIVVVAQCAAQGAGLVKLRRAKIAVIQK